LQATANGFSEFNNQASRHGSKKQIPSVEPEEKFMKLGNSLVCIAALLAALDCCVGAANAADYPTKPIRLIVPWPPGGGTDVFARVIGQKLSERVGYTVVIDNRPGASGNIGAEIVAKSPPDGYTIMLATITLATNPSMYKSLSFDPLKDFAPITLVAGVPHVLVVSPSLPVNSVKDLIALAKAEPGKLNYASAGSGSPFHLAAELFKSMTGTTIVHVPYQGGGPAITAVIGGQVQLTFGNLLAVLPLVKSGKLKALGITSAKRSSAAPELPTIAEEGVRGYDFSSWFGFFAPAGTPKATVAKLNQEIVSILETPEMKQRLTQDGADVVASSAQEFGTYLASETKKWAQVIKQAGIRAD
jgi:tripartite-type tricarboxylate transporter receptor subunit TctC